MHQPKMIHQAVALRNLTYVKSSPKKGLLYKKHEHLRISRYSDSGYAGDKRNRKSTTGYCTFAGRNLMTWRSKKQDAASQSSAEVEYKALAHTACEMM